MLTISNLRVDGQTESLAIDKHNPCFSWIVNSDGKSACGISSHYQTAYRIEAASSEDLLRENRPDLWDSGKQNSSEPFGHPYEGKPLESLSRIYWCVEVWSDQGEHAVSEITWFETAFFSQDEWTADWILAPELPCHTGERGFQTDRIDTPMEQVLSTALPVFERLFTIDDLTQLERVRAYITGLGMFEASVNGIPVTDSFFEPGETDYRTEAFYCAYDIGSLLRNGTNRIRIELGRGYYQEQPDGKYKKALTYYGELMTKCTIIFEKKDDSRTKLDSDGSWFCSTDGPTRMSSWTGGEDYDARKKLPPYEASSDTDLWQPVRTENHPELFLRARDYPHIGVSETIPAESIQPVADGVWLIDFGQNFAGIPCFSLSAETGTTIEFWYGEQLDENGRVSQKTTGEPIWDSYIFAGTGEETWHPSFCYHGFRYMELRIKEGKLGTFDTANFTGLKLRCLNEQTGSFSTSNEAINRIFMITNRSIEANMEAP